MSKKMTRLFSSLNAHSKMCSLPKLKSLFLLTAMFALMFGAGFDSLAQGAHGCDSLDIAWRYYLYEGDFDKAEALVSNCGEASALELRAFIAIKQYKMSLADTLLCKLFQRAKDYQFDPKHLPPSGLNARVEKARKVLCPILEKQRFGLRSPPLLIERETNILRWLEVNLGVGSNFGSEAKNPILLHARSNLAYFAELEFHMVEIANSLQNGRTELPTLAVRAHFPLNRIHSQLPAIGAILRSSIELRDWDSDEIDNVKFRKGLKEARLFVSSFENWRTFEFHIGVSVSSLRTCPYEVSAALEDSLCKESRNVNLFAAYQWRYQKALLMMTWETVPEYKFDRIGPSKPTTQDVLTINVRALPVVWLAFDLGGIWYSELDKNNFNLKLGATIGFSLTEIFAKRR